MKPKPKKPDNLTPEVQEILADARHTIAEAKAGRWQFGRGKPKKPDTRPDWRKAPRKRVKNASPDSKRN